ncbi:hypothetical protein [Sphingomonas sp. GC_Shp_4]|uniref:hypothetical protein n=2 Tax=Sphingomonas TaxID=13687 RepID=UPI00226B404B|nr:hypothetical protein [Sphingomonas sp. GC_Shp_4]
MSHPLRTRTLHQADDLSNRLLNGVTRLDIMPFVPNCAILNNRDRTPDHNFMAKRFRRANLLGPLQSGKDWVGLTCGLWKSFVSLDGDLQDWEQIRTYGWDSAAEWSDGAYLLHYYHCYMLSEGRGMYFAEGSYNAGENIKFFGGVAAAGNYIFNNPGAAEITLFGTATDYSGKGVCVNNAGLIRLIGTRHEQYLPANDPVWHCTTGRVIYEASFVLFAGSVGSVLHPQAKLDTSSASIEFHSTQIYNMSSKAGVAAVGPGRMETFGFINNGNPNIGLELLTESRQQDLLGGAGLFEGHPNGEVYFVNQRAGSGVMLQGGLFNLPYTGGMVDQWNSTETKLSISADYKYSGTKSLRVDKNGHYDNNVLNQIQIMIPIPTRGNILGRMQFLFPNDITDPAFTEAIDPETGGPKFPNGVPIYFRYFWVQQIGTDALGRPILSDRAQFKGESGIPVLFKGSRDWVKRTFNSLYQPPSDNEDQSDKSPQWATHWMIAIDCQSIPPMSFYIDGLQANFIG